MATNQVLQSAGTAILWTNSTYSPGTNTILGTRNANFDIDVASLAAAAARMSLKGDLGATHSALYSLDATTEIASDPAAGGTVDFYWSKSHSVTAAVGNMGGTSGADAAYTGYSGHTLAESLKQLMYMGSLLLGVQNDADGVVIGEAGLWEAPPQRYGVLVVVNNASVGFHTDSVEFAFRMTPVFPDIQASA